MVYAKFKGEGHTIKISGVYMVSYKAYDYCKLKNAYIFNTVTEVKAKNETNYILFILANPHLKEILKQNSKEYKAKNFWKIDI